MLINKYLVHAVGQQLFRVFLGSFAADDHAVYAIAHLRRQLLGFPDQLIGHRMDIAVFLLNKNKEVLPLAFIHRVGLLFKFNGLFRALADA